MKNLELKKRVYTTATAREKVIDFINSFNFEDFEDLPYIKSNKFSVFFDTNGDNVMHDTAWFAISERGFSIVTDNSEGSLYGEQTEIVWTEIYKVFDGTCIYINFSGLVSAMEDFINKINIATEKKEIEIKNFLDFFENWKNREK